MYPKAFVVYMYPFIWNATMVHHDDQTGSEWL
jgi:hypothetical protein